MLEVAPGEDRALHRLDVAGERPVLQVARAHRAHAGQRRFQYRVTSPLLRGHLGTIDVFDLGDGTSLVSYATDCEPDAMALVIGGAAGAALTELRRLLESRDEE